MFIQTEATPNPATLKFLPGKAVVTGNGLDFRDSEAAEQSPLAERLFGVEGVGGVFLGHDFIAVTKSHGEWQHLKPAILGAIMEHYMSGAPVIHNQAMQAPSQALNEEYDAVDEDVVNHIKELLETRVRPAVAHDGGDIVFHGFRQGIVFLHMRGACAGCPSSTVTLKNGIENLLRHFIPQVREVRPV